MEKEKFDYKKLQEKVVLPVLIETEEEFKIRNIKGVRTKLITNGLIIIPSFHIKLDDKIIYTYLVTEDKDGVVSETFIRVKDIISPREYSKIDIIVNENLSESKKIEILKDRVRFDFTKQFQKFKDISNYKIE